MSTKNEQELVVTRVFDAPRELVFKMWTEPEYLAMWWGPKGFTNPVCEIDVKPGGAIRIMMTAPGGAVYPMTGIFREVLAPERIVFTAWPEDGNGNPILEVTNTITFIEEGNKTKQIITAVVTKSTMSASEYADEMNKGWDSSLNKLEKLLQEQV